MTEIITAFSQVKKQDSAIKQSIIIQDVQISINQTNPTNPINPINPTNYINTTIVSSETNTSREQVVRTGQIILKNLTHLICKTFNNIHTKHIEKKRTNRIDLGDFIRKYQIEKLIGSGSFGKVYRAINTITKEKVAIKMILSKSESDIYSISANRERYFLENLKDNPHVVKLIESFKYMNYKCMVFELLGSNLYQLVSNVRNGFSLQLVNKFARQLISFCYMIQPSSTFCGIIHCDLKLENILINNDGKSLIKIIDFGLSCFLEEKSIPYTQSRYYRAPEVLLGLPYSMPIDMWSIGCIIFEIYSGISLFPGANSDDQLDLINAIRGPIPQEMLDKKKPIKILDQVNSSISISTDTTTISTDTTTISTDTITIKKYKPTTLEKLLENKQDCTPEFIDLLKKILEIDPDKRIKPHDALSHPFFNICGIKRKNPDELNINSKSNTNITD